MKKRSNEIPPGAIAVNQAAAARILGLSGTALSALCREGRGPARIVEGRIRLYPLNELHRWAEERATRTPAPKPEKGGSP